MSTFTEISGCFQPDQAKVVLGPSPLVHLQQGAGGGIPLVPGQPEDEEDLPGRDEGTGVWRTGPEDSGWGIRPRRPSSASRACPYRGIPGVWRMGKRQDLKTQDGGADQGGHHQRRGPVLIVGSLAFGGWAKDRT